MNLFWRNLERYGIFPLVVENCISRVSVIYFIAIDPQMHSSSHVCCLDGSELCRRCGC
jgi:hypothetical protein